MKALSLVVAGIVAALLLTGCVLIPGVSGPKLPPVPSTCDFGIPVEANGEADCQKSRVVRWVVELPMQVGIQITEEHGHLAFVAPYICPDGVQTPGWNCKIDAQWRFDPGTRTVWIVSNNIAFGVDAATGIAPDLPARTAEDVLSLPKIEQEAIENDYPPSSISGLVGISASQAGYVVNDVNNKLLVEVDVGCVAGSEKDIPGVSISNGAPNWAQFCTKPVLYAINF